MQTPRKTRLRASLLAAALPLVLTIACAGGGGGGGATLVRMSEFKFEPGTISAKANEPVRLNLQNTGSVAHDLVVKDLNVHSPKVPPGQTVMFEFTPARTGTFEIICDEPGHEPAGMKGSVTVQ